MNSSSNSHTATVHQFPGRTVTARGAYPANATSASVVSLAMRRAPVVEYGAGWYHAEAIREAETSRPS